MNCTSIVFIWFVLMNKYENCVLIESKNKIYGEQVLNYESNLRQCSSRFP